MRGRSDAFITTTRLAGTTKGWPKMSLAMPETDPNVTPRRLLAMAVPAIAVGVLSALILWLLEQAADLLGGVLWTSLPGALGVDPRAGGSSSSSP